MTGAFRSAAGVPDRTRTRSPRPAIARRLPSGRGATEQPNAGSDGPAALTPRFWVALALTSVLAGLAAIAMMALLRVVQWSAYGGPWSDPEPSVLHASNGRILLVMIVVGAVAGPAWALLRRRTAGEVSDVDDVIWSGGRLGARRSFGSATLSELVVGAGASIGREAAPKLLGGLGGNVVGVRFGLSDAQVRLLIACGAGAGFAAVYNVPIGGAIFTAEVMCGSIALPVVLPALASSLVGTLIASIYLGRSVVYQGVTVHVAHPSLIVWAFLAGPVIGLVAAGYVRVIGWVSHRRPTGRSALVAPLLAMAVTAAAGVVYPQLLGNGKELAGQALLANHGLRVLLLLAVLKAVLTVINLGSGMSGGLFTPVLSIGASLGGGLGWAWGTLWSGTPAPAYAMVGATAMIAAAMQAPLSGIVLVLELTGSSFGLAVPMVIAVLLASLVTRYLDGYSIYTARLPARA